MDDYSYVMLVCQLVILEIMCVYHLYAPHCTESSKSQVFGPSCVGSPDVRRDFRRGCGLRPQPGVLAGVGSPGQRRKSRRVPEVPTQIYRVWQTCFDSGLTPLNPLTVVISPPPPAVSFSPRASSFPRTAPLPVPLIVAAVLLDATRSWCAPRARCPPSPCCLERGRPRCSRGVRGRAPCAAGFSSSVPHLCFVARFSISPQVISPLLSLPPVRFRLRSWDLVRRGFRRLPGVPTVGTSDPEVLCSFACRLSCLYLVLQR